jgi:hypothetical protein
MSNTAERAWVKDPAKGVPFINDWGKIVPLLLPSWRVRPPPAKVRSALGPSLALLQSGADRAQFSKRAFCDDARKPTHASLPHPRWQI